MKLGNNNILHNKNAFTAINRCTSSSRSRSTHIHPIIRTTAILSIPNPNSDNSQLGIPQTSQTPAPIFAHPHSSHLVTDRASLTLHHDGTYTLYHSDDADLESQPRRLIAKGRLHLPTLSNNTDSLPITMRTIKKSHWDESVFVWEDNQGHTIAQLKVSPPAKSKASSSTQDTTTATANKWCQNLNNGFVLDFTISKLYSDKAEITVDLDSAGHWFGGGHFIRQIWPVNHASLETGPWYPFDNGANGVNTLLGSHWMTSTGLLVTVDPDTPFLHIGCNAPNKDGRLRKWGVGIQNAVREHLPLHQSHKKIATKQGGGDGLLRVQARSSYRCHRIHHPLSDWTPQLVSSVVSSVLGVVGGDDGTGVVSSGESIDLPTPIAANDADADEMVSVRLALCATHNAKEASLLALKSLSPPHTSPSPSVIQWPIWSTWARYKHNVDQKKVLKYAQEITDRGLARSVMEIDDRWQTAYGDLDFDKKKFPDPKAMIDRLHSQGFQVTCWVTPFFEENSVIYKEGAAKGYFVKSATEEEELEERLRAAGGALTRAGAALLGAAQSSSSSDFSHHAKKMMANLLGLNHKPGFFSWWNRPPVTALDVTNPEAVDWMVSRLKHLQESTGVDSFKFDAGEPCFLPRRFKTHHPMSNPSEYTRLYIKEVAGKFQGGISEVRTGHMTQDVGMLTRMGDRFSTWEINNGLQSIIPTLLTSGLIGYPFILGDMIGGNEYFAEKVDKELMVRWAQASSLMPSLQFSVAPWDLDYQTEMLVSSALDVRRQFEGLLLALTQEAAEALSPICRPLWMLDPYDSETFCISDQFALGDHVIVAPVVTKNATTRDVYLTKGVWRELNDRETVFEGGQWLRGLPAPLEKLPCFVRVDLDHPDVNLPR